MANKSLQVNEWQGRHLVYFYEQENYLKQIMESFLTNDNKVIVMVTGEHRKLLEGLKRPNWIIVDAEGVLKKILVNGLPKANKFKAEVGDIISKTVRTGERLQVLGETVSLLWEEGNYVAAVAVEELWNELLVKHKFDLACVYPMNIFNKSEQISFWEKMQKYHSIVYPSESYLKLDEVKRLKQVAILQQKSQTLEGEMARRNQAEKSLMEALHGFRISEEISRRVIESSADSIKTMDMDGRLLTFIGTGYKSMDIENPDEMVGKNWLDLWTGKNYELAKEALDEARKGEVGRFQGYRPTLKGVPKWWDVMITPIHDEINKIVGVVAVARDITNIKELEERKDDFISATSHELKTPLTSQKAFIQLLKRQVRLNKQKQYEFLLNKIDQQSDKLSRLVTDLLDVNKIQRGKLVLSTRKIDLCKCISEAIKELQPSIKTHVINFKNTVTCLVDGDKNRLTQVIVNLLTNAVKYSPGAKTVEVTMEKRTKKVVVSVQDYGIGVDNKEKKMIFDRFYRSSNSQTHTYPGMGMGLYIASEIVKQHKGKIWVNSEKGKGSTFCFAIPT